MIVMETRAPSAQVIVLLCLRERIDLQIIRGIDMIIVKEGGDGNVSSDDCG